MSEDFNAFLRRLVLDAEFRRRFDNDTEKAIEEFSLDDDEK